MKIGTHIESSLLKKIVGLAHGFGTIAEKVPLSLQPFWCEASPSWKQVHGIHFAEVTDSHQKCGETDALLTFQKGLPVAVVTADCVPVLLARRTGGAVAAIHAGWRGTFAGTVDEVVKFLQSRNEKMSSWVAAVGPAIGPCCYEVSLELVSDFQRKFQELPPELISPSYRKIDLPGIHEAHLKSLGFSEVDLIRKCTQCSGAPDDPVFHSYRREKNSNRQYSGLVFQN